MGEIIIPESFSKECKDCTVIAIALAGNIKYEDAHEALKLCGRKDKHGIVVKKVIQKACKILNLEAKQVKRHGTISKFIRQFPNGNFFCTERGHAFTVIDGTVHNEDNLNRHLDGAWLISNKETFK